MSLDTHLFWLHVLARHVFVSGNKVWLVNKQVRIGASKINTFIVIPKQFECGYLWMLNKILMGLSMVQLVFSWLRTKASHTWIIFGCCGSSSSPLNSLIFTVALTKSCMPNFTPFSTMLLWIMVHLKTPDAERWINLSHLQMDGVFPSFKLQDLILPMLQPFLPCNAACAQSCHFLIARWLATRAPWCRDCYFTPWRCLWHWEASPTLMAAGLKRLQLHQLWEMMLQQGEQLYIDLANYVELIEVEVERCRCQASKNDSQHIFLGRRSQTYSKPYPSGNGGFEELWNLVNSPIFCCFGCLIETYGLLSATANHKSSPPSKVIMLGSSEVASKKQQQTCPVEAISAFSCGYWTPEGCS